ncbi:succinate-semialdehyde dehydrogenase/glutarate-semialdehyde dehydrogenase [Nonlabens dokdonensis]|jgi:succinate-semialdehyde dehydrogenase/glutarate-semialdehyde dehydrogenase|uniref:Aldehyde dehydrogenase n=2 Tax=Nonlabens dokdonensis TaxID=328515 RepID=L7WCX8_NONDD|nr:NAD-dependent succinate-semialdehyde dehydrogenase [Nonlabens dokdonensis]AGC78102.1 aldehyde dehydrogenase [Nonlabens dokdonensis DSW-6]PZX37164.1 succinate-semialdehyde dehydrogenase/glutarate-semialdehyde dehydrogenase [Nonlabens dokdonensis]
MITTINPYNGKELKQYEELTKKEIKVKLEKAQKAFESWQTKSYEHRAKHIKKVGDLVRKNKDQYAKLMTQEMGKPITQSRGELEKCAWLCDFYAEKAEGFLANEHVETEHFKSYVSYEPIGVVLAVMPWNYPFWQVFRFIVPALMAGNVGVLKHASSVMGCAELIDQIFQEAEFPEGCFQNLVIGSDKVNAIIENDIIKAVTLTGSKPAGAAVAGTAGEQIKKTVLELGGNNALVVFNDADVDDAVQKCVDARFQNTGQSCIAGKRLLLHEDIAEDFLEKFTKKVKELVSGDPADENTYIGVMAREDLAEELEELMNISIEKGAELHYGGARDKAYFAPTILTNVTPDMPVFKEETFGPLMAVTVFKTEEEAIKLVNQSKFGLGASLFSTDLKKMEQLAPQIKDGAVFINHKVASHPALPFGGTGISGFGRELSHFGIREFVNIKTVVIA